MERLDTRNGWRTLFGSLPALLLAAFAAPAPGWAAPPQASFSHSVFGDDVNGQDCVAPCFVFFDAEGTTDPEASREFHELDYRWNFGDPGSGNLRNGHSANTTRGPLAGHMYESPGSYTVTLAVFDRDGESSSATVQIDVQDPEVHFAGAIYCVSTGASFGSWCPAGATHVGNQTQLDEALHGTPNVDAAQAWVVLRCSETWPVSGIVRLNNGTRPGLISSRDASGGPCATPPRIHYGAAGGFAAGDSWTVSGLLLDGPNTTSGTESAFSLAHGDDGFVLHRVAVVEASGSTVTVGGGSGTVASRLAVWGSSLEMSGNGDETGSNMFWSGHSFAIMNTLIDNHLQAEFNIRFVGGRHIVLSDSEWRRPGYDSGRNAIQIRGTDPQTSQNGRAVIRRNLFVSHGHSAAPFLRFCRDAGCHDAGPAGGATMEDILVENNHMLFDRPVTTTPNYGLVSIRAGEVTVRNNTIDLSGLGSTGGNLRMCNVINEPGGGGSYSNVHCFNNTIYASDTTNQGLILCDAQVGSGHRCYNNLVYTPGMSGSYTPTSGGWLSGGNLRAATSPFALGDQLGVRFGTTGAEFELSPSDQAAADNGVSISHSFTNSLHYDWKGDCRAAPIDIGALERDGSQTACPSEAPANGPQPPAAPVLLP